MPAGLVRSGNFSHGNPVPATNPNFVSNPMPQTTPSWNSNPIPVADPTFNSNPVNWLPSPAHFGNIIGGGSTPSGFLLEDGSGVILLEDGTILLLETSS